MSIEERIRQVRLGKKMNQTEFAEKIGIGQAGLSAIEKGIRGITERNIALICEKFNVNKEWLETGSGEPYRTTPTDEIDRLAEKYGLPAIIKKAVEMIVTLEKDELDALAKKVEKFVAEMSEDDEATNPSDNKVEFANELAAFKLTKEPTKPTKPVKPELLPRMTDEEIEEEVEEFRRELEAEKRARLALAYTKKEEKGIGTTG